jgi:mRNA interferase YafQ
MRTIEWTTAFKRDFKRVKRGLHGPKIDGLLSGVLNLLIHDKPLPAAFEDHPLSGEWKGVRDCHLKPDLLLLYRKPDAKTLQLVRLGSHSELFG